MTSSNPSSEVSIEEIGSEEVNGNDDGGAEVVGEEEGSEVQTAPTAENESGDAEPETSGGERKEEEEEEEDAVAVAAAVPQASSSMSRNPADFEEEEDDDDEDDEFEDETLLERLMGLTEMFPESVRLGTHLVCSGSVAGTKWMYSASRNLSWIIFSSATILFLPIMIETERLGIEEMQKQQQRQILLGPGAAISGGGHAPPPLL